MLPGREYLVEVERRKGERVRAQAYRLRRLASSGDVSTVDNVYRRLLVRLGGLLVDWGCRLQDQFAAEACPGTSMGEASSSIA